MFGEKVNDRSSLMEGAVDPTPKNSPASDAPVMLASPRATEFTSDSPWQNGIPKSTPSPEVAPAIYDPTLYSQTELKNETPNQAMIVSSQSAHSPTTTKRCRNLKISAVFSTIFMIIFAATRTLQYLIEQEQPSENQEANIDAMMEQLSHYENEFPPAIDVDRFRPMVFEDRDILQYVKQLNSVYVSKNGEDDSSDSRKLI